jgi:iron complex outermembrane receptor protein
MTLGAGAMGCQTSAQIDKAGFGSKPTAAPVPRSINKHARFLTRALVRIAAPMKLQSTVVRPLLSRCLILLVLCCAEASADDSGADPLQEVVVTATKRETKLSDTPISITVLGSDVLRTTNADSFSDYARLVPGLTALDSGPGERRYALRGLQSAGEPEVALYYDEIPISGLPGGSLDTGDDQPDLKLWDVDRIEVLRGPQGVEYGNGSMGGAIRIISKQPQMSHLAATAEAEAGVTQGGLPSYGASVMVNAPIVEDRLAVRLALYERDEGGWIDDLERGDIDLRQPAGQNLNWQHTWGARLSARLAVSKQWTVSGVFYYQDLRTGDTSEIYPSFAPSGDRYVAAAFVHTPWDDKIAMGNLTSTYDLGWASFVATGSYQNRVVDQSIDTTRFLLSLFGCDEFTWHVSCHGPALVPAVSYAHEGVMASSGEIRLVSERPGRLQWTAGGFIQRASTYRHGQVAVANASGYLDFNPDSGIADDRLFGRTNYDQFNQYAFFGEGTYDVYRGLDVTVGLRWFHSYRSDQQIVDQQFFPGQPTGMEPFQEFRQSALFKKFQLSKKLSPNSLLYVEAAQGFRAGGPNYPGGFDATAPAYRSDSVWDYELGWKSSFLENQVNLSGAVFRINWSDLQQLVPTSLFSYIQNAGSARADGFEAEVEARATSRLELSLGGSATNAHLIGAQPASSDPAMQLYSGERLGGVPRWTGNAGAVYDVLAVRGFNLRARVDYTYQSSRPTVTATQSSAFFVVGASSLTSLHLQLDHEDRWSLGVHVNNVFNAFAPVSGKALDSNLIHTVTAAAPRTVMMTLRASF